MKKPIILVFGLVTMLLPIACERPTATPTGPSITIERPEYTTNGDLVIGVRLSGHEEADLQLPRCLNLRVFVNENEEWTETHPYQPWNAYYDKYYVASDAFGAEPTDPIENTLCRTSEQGYYEATVPGAFVSTREWSETQPPMCPFEEFIVVVSAWGLEERQAFDCQPLPLAAFDAAPLEEGDTPPEAEEGPVLPAGLVAYYPLNGDASDESGGENHGTVHGAIFTSGRIGQGASFDGADDYIQITNPVDTPLGDRVYTIALWAKADQWEGKNRHMVAIGDVKTQKGDVSVAYHHAGWAGGGRPVGIYVVHFGADWSTGVEVQPGRWYHFSATYDGATERFYMDGVLQASGGYGGFNIDSSPIIIGAQAWDGLPADEFDGVIDEVRIYNRALTGEEIQALYEYR